MTEFILTDFPDGDIARTIDRKTLAERLRQFISKGDKARIREIGSEWGTWRSEPEAVEAVLDRVDRMGVGPRIVIQREDDRDMRAIREVSRDTEPRRRPRARGDPRRGLAPLQRPLRGTVALPVHRRDAQVSKHG